jgi:hypothetical protein
MNLAIAPRMISESRFEEFDSKIELIEPAILASGFING